MSSVSFESEFEVKGTKVSLCVTYDDRGVTLTRTDPRGNVQELTLSSIEEKYVLRNLMDPFHYNGAIKLKAA